MEKNILFNKKNNSLLFLILLTIITSLIVYWKVIIQMEFGTIWDSYDFLSNALYFAGQGYGYADLTRPPFFPFLVSLLFKLGFTSESTIFILDGVFYILATIGLYLFLRLRFGVVESFLGGVLFSTFPLMLLYTSIGLSDIPSLCFSIWALYFIVMGVKTNQKYFYLAFPLAMLAFLTRYPSALIVIPILFYLFINRDRINYINVLIGILFSFLILIPVLVFFYQAFGNPIYPFVFFSSAPDIPFLSSNLLSYVDPSKISNVPVYAMGQPITCPENIFYNPNIFAYITNFPNYVGWEIVCIALIVLIGCFFSMVKRLIKVKTFPKIFEKNILAIILLFTILIVTFGKISFMLSEIIFVGAMLFSYNLVKNHQFDGIDIDFFVIVWGMTFFIFHSIYVMKDERYFITMAPAVSYILIWGLHGILKNHSLKFGNRNLTFEVVSIVILAILLVSTINYMNVIQQDNQRITMTKNTIETSEWFKNNEPAYKSKLIYADYWPHFNWYLKMNLKPMPNFKEGKIYFYELKSYNLDQDVNKYYNDELHKNNADYYISLRENLNLTGYIPVKKSGDIIIYKRIN